MCLVPSITYIYWLAYRRFGDAAVVRYMQSLTHYSFLVASEGGGRSSAEVWD